MRFDLNLKRYSPYSRADFGSIFCLQINSVLDRFSNFYFWGCFFMDYHHFHDFSSMKGDSGCGFLVFGCFQRICQILGLFMLFGFGLKVLQCSCHFKGLTQFLCGFSGASGEFKSGFCSKYGFFGKYNLKILTCKGGLLHFLKNSNPPMIKKLEGTKQETLYSNGDVKAKANYDDDVGDEQEECYNEDEVFDVMILRKLIKMERHRADDACLELEKERMAASSAAEEAMAMILRLQNEKSLVELESHQFHRLAKEKQLHDQEVIQSLRWIVMKHELERNLLEDRLRYCKEKLKQYKNCDDEDQCEGVDESLSFLDSLGDGLISSLDMGLSPQKMVVLREEASVENVKGNRSETRDLT